MAEEPDNVVPLPTGRDEDESPLRRRRPPGPYCSHRKASIDMPSRKLYCRKCDAELDPYQFLSHIAAHPENWRDSAKADKAAAEQARRELAEVERLLRNAKARLKRVVRKAGPEPEPPLTGNATRLRKDESRP
jgi:hypothetical protein